MVARAREVRWWMAWRSVTQNIEWLTIHRDAVTSVHPAHHMIDIDFDGSLRLVKQYDPDKHVKPYVDMGIDVIPCIDFYVSSRSKSESAIMQGLVEGDADILQNLQQTAATLAKIAHEHRFAGYVVDYEPSFDYTERHAQGLTKFLSILKQELSTFDAVQARVSMSGATMKQVTKKFRVGVCVSDWGIIDVRKDSFATIYQSALDFGDIDFLMSMGYTYYPPQPGLDGFMELEKRCALVAALFKEHTTIGIGVAANDSRFSNWFSLGDDAIADFIRSLAKTCDVNAISLWGRWYTEPENKVEKFTAPLVDFLKHGPPAYVEDENEDLSKGQNALDSCEHHFFMAPSERALYCKKCAVVKKTGLSDRALTAVADVTTRSTVTEIIYAGYGAEGEIPCDVTEVVRKQFAEGQRCFRASNDIFGDPHPNLLKSLFVVWKKGGRTHSGIVREHSEQAIEL